MFHIAVAVLTACGGTVDGGSTLPSVEPEDVSHVTVYEVDHRRAEVAVLNRPGQALVRLVGFDHELNDVPMPVTLVHRNGRAFWETTYRGETRSLLFSSSREPERFLLNAFDQGDSLTPRQLSRDLVDPELGNAMVQDYRSAREAGRIEALQRFDRDATLGRHQEAFQNVLAGYRTACGDPELEVTVDWASEGDAGLRDQRMLAACGAPLKLLRDQCRFGEEVDVWRKARFDRVSCRGRNVSNAPTYKIENRSLVVQVDDEERSPRAHRTMLKALPDETHGTWGDFFEFAMTRVCTDDTHTRFLVAQDHIRMQARGYFFGTRSDMHALAPPFGNLEGDFFEPRFARRNGRHANVGNIRSEQCAVTCGERRVEMQSVSGQEKHEVYMLRRRPSRFVHAPHALARDDAGIYYYVDRGATASSQDAFRLFRGRRGAMRQLDMTDVASDSRGGVFESRTGVLRLVLDQDDAEWVRGTAKVRLKRLSIIDNLDVIYNELGVYLSESLGTPCEVL